MFSVTALRTVGTCTACARVDPFHKPASHQNIFYKCNKGQRKKRNSDISRGFVFLLRTTTVVDYKTVHARECDPAIVVLLLCRVLPMLGGQQQLLLTLQGGAPDVRQIINLQSVTLTIIFSMSSAISNQLVGRVSSTLTIVVFLLLIILIIWIAATFFKKLDDGKGVFRFWKTFFHSLVSMIFLLFLYVSTQTITFWFTDTSSTGSIALVQVFSVQIWMMIIGLTFIQVILTIRSGPQRYVDQLAEETAAQNTPFQLRQELEELKAKVKSLEKDQ